MSVVAQFFFLLLVTSIASAEVGEWLSRKTGSFMVGLIVGVGLAVLCMYHLITGLLI